MSKEALKRHGISTPKNGEKYGKIYAFSDGPNTLYVYAHSADGATHDVSIRNSGLMSNHKAINSLINYLKAAPIEEEQIDELKGIKSSDSKRRAYLSKASKSAEKQAGAAGKAAKRAHTLLDKPNRTAADIAAAKAAGEEGMSIANKGLRRIKYGLKAAKPDIETLASRKR